MKKLIASTIAGISLFAIAASSFGQGTITFQNSTVTSPVTFGPLASNPGAREFGAAGLFTYGLYVGASTATSFSQLTLMDTVASPNAPSSTFFTAGALSGGNVTGQGNVGAANGFAGLVSGTTYVVSVAGWTAADGSSLAAAIASGAQGLLIGTTGLGSITAVSGSTPVPNVFGTGAGQLGAFTLNPVPEPTTIALGGLGAAALLFFRRRK